MASESPGDDTEVSPCGACDTNQCLNNDQTRHPGARAQAPFLLPSLLLLLLSLLPGLAGAGAGGGLCDPLLCTCEASSANCSYRGFLSLPSGLHYELKTLDLSNNDIQQINRTELSQYNNLLVLDLSRNRITTFEGEKHSPLVRLDLSHNQISTLRRITVAQMNNLVYLDLSYNKIASIPAKVFPIKSKLEVLNLASNSIELLEPECFTQLQKLKELKLNRNKLSSLPKLTFFKLQSLETLELNKNKLEKIPGLTFHGLKNVKILKLRKNNLRYLDDGAFYGLDSIEQLFLDRNQVVTVNKGWLYGLVTLQVLSLSYNQVDYIEDDGWEFCKQVHTLNLQGNQIEIVERNILRRLPSLKHLNLKENLISHIEATEDTFTEIPQLEELYLDGNQLSHTIEDTVRPFKHLSKLRILGISGNSIKSMGNMALSGLDNLEVVDLSNNVISTIQESPVTELGKLARFRLDSSSLLCDCNLRWFAEWVNTTEVKGVTATCAHPESLKDRRVTSIESELFTCEDFPKPYILVEPKSQIALRGKDLTLHCRAASTSPAPMAFVWKKDGTILELGACQTGRSCIENTEHSFDGKGMEVTSELKLTNLTNLDIGSYQCIVDNVYGATYSPKADITVYVFPQFVLTPEDKTVTGGTSITLACSATGFPMPDISWQKDSGSDFPAARERRMHVDPDTNTYVIKNVKADDMGVYTCSATNLAGSVTTNTTITVLEVPRFVKPMENKTVPLGENAVLECQASGAPRPSLVWTKNGGQLVATERHFFTADNQLLIIVKVEAEDVGQYQCSMHNSLGTVSGSSFLTIDGAGAESSEAGGHGTATSVIVIAVVSCVIGTSAVWMVIICWTRTRSRNRRKDWEDELTAKDIETPTTGMPLLGAEATATCAKEDDSGSERDSGTGDSKKSGEVEPGGDSIVDTVIHNFLAARGEHGGPGIWANTTSLSDFDTGISSLGDSTVIHNGGHSLHRRGCPRIKSLNQKPQPQTAKSSVTSAPPVVTGGVSVISYAVDNPLYDSLPLTVRPRPEHEAVAETSSDLTSAPASVISDSVAYCGRFPAKSRGQCDAASSVASVSSVPSVAASDLPITFNTFHPHSSQPSSLRSGHRPHKQRKRLSAIELPTGETLLPISDTGKSGELSTASPANLEKDLGDIIQAAKEYRGGGTLPRKGGIQQEWLEASLKYTAAEAVARSESERTSGAKERGSRRSIFRHSTRRSQTGDRSQRRSRRRSSGSGSVSVAGSVCQSNDEHSTVGSKNRDMF